MTKHIIIAVLVVISIFLGVYANIQSGYAAENAEKARMQEQAAIEAATEARRQAESAILAKKEAEKQIELVKRALIDCKNGK